MIWDLHAGHVSDHLLYLPDIGVMSIMMYCGSPFVQGVHWGALQALWRHLRVMPRVAEHGTAGPCAPCLAALLSAGAGPEGVLISGSELLRPTDPGDWRCRGGVDLAPAWLSCDAGGGVPFDWTYSCCCRLRLEGAAAVVAGALSAAADPSSSSALPAFEHRQRHW